MRFPAVRYAPTGHDDYLELFVFDGTCRGVIFENASAAMAALTPGRAEVDCVAVLQGFMPLGATFVSGAGIARRVSGDVDGDDAGDDEAIRRFASKSTRITPESDRLARDAAPVASDRYRRIAREMK
jgi:hypothetical protein